MKPRHFLKLALLLMAVAVRGAPPPAPGAHAPRYRYVDLGTIGGIYGGGNSINQRGWASGFSTLVGDAAQHATLWAPGVSPDLGTLGGDNSGVEWLVHNENGMIAGISETADVDPNSETWSCAYFFPSVTHHVCRGFVWQDGVMTELPTLGGTHGYAAGMNDLGQIAGWAETPSADPTCNPPQVLQFEAVVYGPGPGEIHALPPLAGDPDGAATAVNDNGQVVGISGLCSNAFGGLSAQHALLWENGVPTDIGSLGGQAWNTPTAINRKGEIVGFSDLPNDDPAHPNYHAFLWTRAGGIQDLQTVPGDVRSQALGINNHEQVVGLSIDAAHHLRAFLWQDGVDMDLNALVPPGTPFLIYANDINDRGEITGEAFDPVSGTAPAFMLVPVGEQQTEAAAPTRADLGIAPPRVAVPESVRRQVERGLMLGSRRQR